MSLESKCLMTVYSKDISNLYVEYFSSQNINKHKLFRLTTILLINCTIHIMKQPQILETEIENLPPIKRIPQIYLILTTVELLLSVTKTKRSPIKLPLPRTRANCQSITLSHGHVDGRGHLHAILRSYLR